MAFTTEEILSYFSAKGSNPLASRVPENVDILPTPGHGMYSRGKQEVERRREDVFASRDGRSLDHSYQSAGFVEPVYNLHKSEDVDVSEDYFQLPHESLDACAGGTAVQALYERYSFATDKNPHLPVTERREDVIRTIESNQVTIIQGATGSGKSTLVPQYILEHYASQQRHCNIVCTQPRRIATRSIAKYVAECRHWQLATLVGYQVYNDKSTTDDTRLTFVTTGVLLEKLVSMKNMNEYTHVILDEVHERNLETDLCLLLVRKLLRTNSRQVKVVLMSATLESQEYAQYFAVRLPSQASPIPAPVLSVEGRVWPVMEFYLDDLRAFGQVEGLMAENPRVTPTQMEMAKILIQHFNALEEEDPEYGKGDFFRGTVLCFLPGMPEIREMERVLKGDKIESFAIKNRLNILPLHSEIPLDEQCKAFIRPEGGFRKVILATNIAESSITVPDIKYVVDFCMVKQMITDTETGFDRLVTTWASKAALKQRMGRAGRVAEGRCYRLIKREFYRKYCPPYTVPEMQRRSIEHPVLKTKKLDLGEPKQILSLALQPPSLVDIEKAVTTLKELGAITVTCGGVVNLYDGDLTFVGEILESLPISARLGRLLLLGHVFDCLEECLVIAAALSQRSIFTKPFQKDMQAYRSKMNWSDRSSSDCIAVLNAYKEWIKRKERKYFTHFRHEHNWCQENLLHLKALQDVADTIRDLSSRLSRFGIQVQKNLATIEPSKKDLLILKVVLCGAFYPNYFRWGMGDEEVNRKEFSGHNQCTTVMLAGLPPNSHRYAGSLCYMFRDCVTEKGSSGPHGKALHFDGSKVFVEFEQFQKGGQGVLDSVVIALKKRHMREPLELYTSDYLSTQQKQDLEVRMERLEEAIDKADKQDEDGLELPEIKAVELPRSGDIEVVVTEVVDAGHFWVQRHDIDTIRSLREIMASISDRTLMPLIGDLHQLNGTYCLAMFNEDGHYYRARIDSTNLQHNLASVTFIDYGNSQTVPLSYLMHLSSAECNLPAQAMECYLTCVRPSACSAAEGTWSEDANLRFEELVRDKRLVAKVFSKVNNTLRVELCDGSVSPRSIINEQLVLEGYAAKCEEPYLSKIAFTQTSAQEKAEQAASKTRSHVDEEDAGLTPKPVPLTSPSHIVRKWTNASPLDIMKLRPSASAHKVTLKGPSSPYEVKFYCMTNVGSLRPSRVERDSVNSIVVDAEPHNKHDKIMVAANVALNPSGNATLARETTLLPNLLGLPYLICLLFAPSAEMRCDTKKRRYVGAVCGLGCDPMTGQSLYSDHDIELIFDTLITQEDLDLINRVRSCMNVMLSTDPSERSVVAWGEYAIQKIQSEARNTLLSLLHKQREVANPYTARKKGWNQVPPRDLLVPERAAGGGRGEVDEDGPDSLVPFSLLSGIVLEGNRRESRSRGAMSIGELREAMRELHSKASKSELPETLVCMLCEATGMSFSTPRELLDHIHSRPHMVRERRLWDDRQAPGVVQELKRSTQIHPPPRL